MSRRVPDRGAATAELALCLPLLLTVTVGLVWLLGGGAAPVRTVDAAREAARAAARGDDTAAAVARGLTVAPTGSRITVTAEGDRVVATATGRVAGPGGLFGFLPGAGLHATAVAAVEGAP
ncbi:MAG: TadE family type IV pilus minor pilin [Nocardioides sp.]